MAQIIAIVGPTAVGKTTLSIALAKAFHAEIISCDSMQFYQGLSIGTAKVKPEEMQGINHHFIDSFPPDTEFSVAEFQETVRKRIDQLIETDTNVILVGGSGLYVSGVLYDYRFLGAKREEDLDAMYEKYSTDYLAQLLKETAPKLASQTDMKNRRRVLRALQKSDADSDASAAQKYYPNAKIIGLDMDRELLYQRINDRVDQMVKDGLVEEAKWLYERFPNSQAAQAIGYKEFFSAFHNNTKLLDAIELIKRNSRHYAKRQLTWFRNKMDAVWIDVNPNDFEPTIQMAIQYCRE